jgi:hypothetical protein
MSGKTDGNRPIGSDEPRRRWIPARVTMRITGHVSPESLRNTARVKGKIESRKHPGTGRLEYELSAVLAYAGKTEADVAHILADSAGPI